MIEEKREREDAPAPAFSFPITAEMRTWAAREVPGVDVDAETAAFLDWNQSNGKSYTDPEAAWRNWMRKAPSFQKSRANNAPQSIQAPNYSAIGKPDDRIASKLAEALLGNKGGDR